MAGKAIELEGDTAAAQVFGSPDLNFILAVSSMLRPTPLETLVAVKTIELESDTAPAQAFGSPD